MRICGVIFGVLKNIFWADETMRYITRIPFLPLFVMLVGVCVLFLPLWPDPEKFLWADNFDGYLIIWILEWGHHVLFENFQPSQFWQANSFFPHPHSLAFSESLLSAQLFYGPLRQLGFGLLTSMYATFGFTTVIAGCVTDYGLRRLQFSVSERIVFLLVGHFSLPLVSFLYHYQMFGFQFVPSILIWTYVFFSNFDRLSFHVSIALYLLSSCYSTYLVVAMPVIALPGICYLLVKRIRNFGWRQLHKDLLPVESLLWGLCYFSILYLVLLKPYLLVGANFELPSYDDARTFSAKPSSLFKGKSIHSFWYNPGGYSFGGWERAYFPGYALLLVCLSILFISLAKRNDRPAAGLLSPGLLGASTLTFVWAYLLSLGPFIRGTDIPLPYWFISEILPGFRNMRTPGRFGAFLSFPLAVFCVYFIRQFSSILRIRAVVVAAIVILVIGIESIPKFPVFPYVVEGDEDYSSLKGIVSHGDPIIIIPSTADDHMQTILRVNHQLIGSRHHWGRLIIGYGSKETREMHELLERERKVNLGIDSIESFILYARELGIKFLFIRTSSLSPFARDVWLKYHNLKGATVPEKIGPNLLLRL